MKNLLPLLLLIFLNGCISYTNSTVDSSNRVSTSKYKGKYKGKFSSYLDLGETEINSSYTQVFSKTSDGKYIERTFYPEIDQITALHTYATSKRNTKNGKSRKWYDDGFQDLEGQYLNGKKDGFWKYYFREIDQIRTEGVFTQDKKEGIWKTYDKEGRLKKETTYTQPPQELTAWKEAR